MMTKNEYEGKREILYKRYNRRKKLLDASDIYADEYPFMESDIDPICRQLLKEIDDLDAEYKRDKNGDN